MNYTHKEYIDAGYVYERTRDPELARAYAHRIRAMIDSESNEEQSHARYLVEQGRREARQ